MKENFWQAQGLQGGCRLASAALACFGDQCLRQAQWISCSAESICYVAETWSIRKVNRKGLELPFPPACLTGPLTAGESVTSLEDFHCVTAKPLCQFEFGVVTIGLAEV